MEFEIEPTDQLTNLIESQMDLGIRVQEPSGADHVYIRLMENSLILCASQDYLKRNKSPLRHPKDLGNHSLLTLKVYENCQFERTEFRLRDFTTAQKFRCESRLFLTELTRQGAGIAVRSTWDVQPLIDAGDLVQVLNKYRLQSFGNVYAVIPNRRLLAHRVRVFIDFINARIRD